MLYIVPTPIGNLKDITLRALDVLKEVDLILAEDTRTSSHLLNHYQVTKPISPYHQHNEHKVLQHLIDQLVAGKKMALVTDAGTPGISDPAFLLIRECIKNDIRIETLPGPTAFVPALVNSGIPTNRFVFEGFIPLKKGINPSNTNRLVGMPLLTKAGTNAVAPGRDSILISFFMHSLINKKAGSEIPGVPASVTNAIFFPDAS